MQPIEGDWDPALIRSNTFEMEWPPRSGRRRTFQGIERAAWFGIADARRNVLKDKRFSSIDCLRAPWQLAATTDSTGRTMFDLTFLGSSASVPSADRDHPGLLVEAGGHRIMVDCGEGMQRQLLRSGAGFRRLDRLLLTHGHLTTCSVFPVCFRRCGCGKAPMS